MSRAGVVRGSGDVARRALRKFESRRLGIFTFRPLPAGRSHEGLKELKLSVVGFAFEVLVRFMLVPM
jgi:hypothetical protein